MEKKEGRLKGHKDVVIQDLPGIYSLSPYTLEEVVARGFLVKQKNCRWQKMLFFAIYAVPDWWMGNLM